MSSSEPHSAERVGRQYSFGDFTLDVEHRLLRRGGEEVTLRSRSFDVLVHLVDRHGQLVTKAALMEAIWPDTAVTDNSLAQCMVEIRRALGDDGQQIIRTVARRGYQFAAPVTRPVAEFPHQSTAVPEEPRPSPVAPSVTAGKVRRYVMAAAALVLAILSISIRFWLTYSATESGEPIRATPLTALPGVARFPSLSPDGNYVAFSWNGPKEDNPDIYVQQIGSAGPPSRLTTDLRNDYNPVWSPDGRWIAFLRRQWGAGKSELLLIPPLGGLERKLAEIRSPDIYVAPPYLAWCPDSACLVVTESLGEGKPVALFVVSLEGEERPLSKPQPPAWGDTNPAVSPDGRWLVFRRNAIGMHTGELYLLTLGQAPGSPIADGEPKRLTPAAMDAQHPTWMPDSREILFSARDGLWRLVTSGYSVPARLPFVGDGGLMPVVSGSPPARSPRLVYVRNSINLNIWRVDTAAPGAPASSPPVVSITSTRRQLFPQFSPDGARVAFSSDRSGKWEIWLANPDGSNALPLTSQPGTKSQGSPQWSPDGERIVFHSNWEVFVIPASGGKPRSLISHPTSDGYPSFSRNGQWVYFTSNRSGAPQIWKVPSTGGDAVQITHSIGYLPLESPDGAYIYYVETMDRPSPLWRLPVSGGVPVIVLQGVVLGNFQVLERGIYYIDRPSGEGGHLYMDQPSGETRLQYYDFASRRSTTVARNLGNVDIGFTASRDGRMILYSRRDSWVDDLMLVENFR